MGLIDTFCRGTQGQVQAPPCMRVLTHHRTWEVAELCRFPGAFNLKFELKSIASSDTWATNHPPCACMHVCVAVTLRMQ